MPRYRITQHLSGWKIIENFVDAQTEEEATELYNKGDENLNLSEWKEVEEEYRINDTEFELVKDYPPKNSWGMIKPSKSWIEGYNKWKKEDKK